MDIYMREKYNIREVDMVMEKDSGDFFDVASPAASGVQAAESERIPMPASAPCGSKQLAAVPTPARPSSAASTRSQLKVGSSVGSVPAAIPDVLPAAESRRIVTPASAASSSKQVREDACKPPCGSGLSVASTAAPPSAEAETAQMPAQSTLVTRSRVKQVGCLAWIE
eukprot:TRINITY_DN21335_c0_g1_i1.p2 TRINITY_DN21335_c0_g1~~TRINITY_DN21335_c0_g1_i1.p2  ORF type:complete len:168 (+),score=41.05 TRINITY_DN21335_c0_g1_i1:346-849(+)